MIVAETADYSAICAQTVTFAGRPILVQTNVPKILRYARDFLTFICADEWSSAPVATVTLLVEDAAPGSGMVSPWFRGRDYFAVASFSPADNFWFNLRTREVLGILSREMANDREQWRRHIFPTLFGILSTVIDVVPVHAGCVAARTGGILLAAPSGTGKSTLTVALAKLGYSVLADDWTFLTTANEQVQAWGIPASIKLLPDAIEFFPELGIYTTGVSLNGEIAYEVDPQKCFGLAPQSQCDVACVVLLERTQNRGCSIRFAESGEVLERLIDDLEILEGSLQTYRERQVAAIRRLSNVPCLRLSFNAPPREVAQLLDHTVSTLG